MAKTSTPEIPTAAAVPLSTLQPAPWNPRFISDERFKNLCRSIERDPEFLWRRPVLAQADGTIYAGNMRYRAAQHLGHESIPAIVEDVPDQLACERALRDNAQWGEWEEDELGLLLKQLREDGSELDLLGFDDRSLQQLLDRLDRENGLTDPDDVPPLPEEPVSKLGDLWLLGDHRLLCGDATDPHDVAMVMDGQKAKVMATDPPYLVDYSGGNPDLVEVVLAPCLDAFGELIEDVAALVHPAALLPGRGKDLAQDWPEAEGAVAHGQLRRHLRAACLEVDEQLVPALLALAEAVLDRDKLRLAVFGDSDEHEDALAVIVVEADGEVHPVGPKVHVLLR